MNKTIFIVLIIAVFIFIGGIVGIINNNDLVINEEDRGTKVVLDDKVIDNIDGVLVEDNEIYLPIEFIKNNFISDIRLDEDEKMVYLDMTDIEFKLEDEKLTEYVKNNISEINLLIKYVDDMVLIPMGVVSKILNLETQYNESSNIVVIERPVDEIKTGKVISEGIKLKLDNSFEGYKNPSLSEGEIVRIYKEEENYYNVRTEEGYLGLIKKEDIEVDVKIMNTENQINTLRDNYQPEDKINITWEYVNHTSPNIADEEKIEGLDVICPTWFSVKEDGIVESKADMSYVKAAHEKGYKVWGLVDNSFDAELTSQILNDEELKDKVISQILLYSSLYDLDGINIDFENIYYDDKKALVTFVGDLTDMLKRQNLVVSIDVTVPWGSKQWSLVYDRTELAKIVDYVALMAYDEHWGTSPESGSVASIGWVEKGISKSLDYIPKEKLLLGVPFYTRVWKETTDEDGNVEVTSKAVPIRNVEEILEENDAEIIWDEDVGQYFATYKGEEENVMYKIWIEDSKSLDLKIQLAHKYDIKGIASWRKGYEYDEIWEVIRQIKIDKDLI